MLATVATCRSSYMHNSVFSGTFSFDGAYMKNILCVLTQATVSLYD